MAGISSQLPKDIEDSWSMAHFGHNNLDKVSENAPRVISPKITSPLRVSNMPSTYEIMKATVDRLNRVEQLWQLGDLESHYLGFTVQNCEPYGVIIHLFGRHNKDKYLVVPTLTLHLFPDEALEEALGRLLPSVCEFTGCDLDSAMPNPSLNKWGLAK